MEENGPPPRPATAFELFSNVKEDGIRRSAPGGVSEEEVKMTVEAMWNTSGQDERAAYRRMYIEN